MFQKKKVNHAVASVIAAGIAASGASIASSQAIEEVIVTTKSAASTQDIPVAVSAVTAEKMDQMGVSNFQDYLVQLPGVTAGGLGPGQNTIYIRGVASTTPATSVAGVSGLAPNVAFYLDEQPLAQPEEISTSMLQICNVLKYLQVLKEHYYLVQDPKQALYVL